MASGSDPAFPVYEAKAVGNVSLTSHVHSGLSKREWFAGMAMQGLIARCSAAHMTLADVAEQFAQPGPTEDIWRIADAVLAAQDEVK